MKDMGKQFVDGQFLERFFWPESVAVVGASNNPLSLNHSLVANLVKLGFKGRIYPVNPKEKMISGLRAYSSVKSIDGVVDLAVVAVQYTRTLSILMDCIEKGVRGVAIVAGGFSEGGEKGRRIQEEMASLLKESGIRAIGPNALSPINTSANLVISFYPLERMKKGELSLIFQSGFYELRLRWFFSDFNLRLNKLIDLGNKMDINEVDALAYLANDPETRVIGIHLESVEGDGREFLNLIHEASRRKHVVVLKSGRTEAGARAAASHTGVIVQGSDLVFNGALKQSGAIRAQTIEEFFEISRALERFGSLRMKGGRIALATFPGGEAVISTDLCQQEGLSLADVKEETFNKLKPVFPPWEILGNPFDLGVCVQFHDPWEVFRRYLVSMSEDQNVDGIAVGVAEWVVHEEFIKGFNLTVKAKKPMVLWIPGMRAGGYEALEWLEDQHVPVFPSPASAIKALSALHRSSLFKLQWDGALDN
jgi:acetyltransferase